MSNNYLKLVPVLLAIIFASCKPEKEETVATENYKGVIVINEGGFLKSNGSVGIYKPGSGEYFDAFAKANGRPLGDVVQSVTLINGKYYIIVNNSNKIEVVNQSDFKSVTTIVLNQPRNIVKVSANKAYVSQLNTNDLSVIDLTTNEISATIDMKSSTDQIVMMNNKVYVGKAYANMLYVINPANDMVTDSIVVGSGAGTIVNAGTDKIAVFCLGVLDFNNGSIIENGKIAIINKDSNEVERFIPLTGASYGGPMAYHAGNLYFSFGDEKLYSVSATTVATPTVKISIIGGIYGLTIDDSDGSFYITDALDYTSAGKVFIYNQAGTLVKQFTAGVVPGRFVFNY
ncbi:MAG: hypothetical protein V4613_11655 [Bacteroidota bacterium]